MPNVTTAAKIPLRVQLIRNLPDPFFIVRLPDGSTEELDPEDAYEWFRLRGANMDVVEKACDWKWNFGEYKETFITIQNPKDIKPTMPEKLVPRI